MKIGTIAKYSLSLTACILLSNYCYAAPQQRQAQPRQESLTQVPGWRSLGFVDRVNPNIIRPLQCQYRLTQYVPSPPSYYQYNFYEFDSTAYLAEQRRFILKKNLNLESSESLFSGEQNGQDYTAMLRMRSDRHIVSCKLELDFASEEKLLIHCYGTGPEQVVPGVDGEPLVLPGGLFESLNPLDSNTFILQENC